MDLLLVGCCFVNFERREDAEQCIAKLHNKHTLPPVSNVSRVLMNTHDWHCSLACRRSRIQCKSATPISLSLLLLLLLHARKVHIQKHTYIHTHTVTILIPLTYLFYAVATQMSNFLSVNCPKINLIMCWGVIIFVITSWLRSDYDYNCVEGGTPNHAKLFFLSRPIFEPFGDIEEFKVLRDYSGQSKGCGFVRYNNRDSVCFVLCESFFFKMHNLKFICYVVRWSKAIAAIRTLDQQYKIGNLTLQVRFAGTYRYVFFWSHLSKKKKLSLFGGDVESSRSNNTSRMPMTYGGYSQTSAYMAQPYGHYGA